MVTLSSCPHPLQAHSFPLPPCPAAVGRQPLGAGWGAAHCSVCQRAHLLCAGVLEGAKGQAGWHAPGGCTAHPSCCLTHFVASVHRNACAAASRGTLRAASVDLPKWPGTASARTGCPGQAAPCACCAVHQCPGTSPRRPQYLHCVPLLCLSQRLFEYQQVKPYVVHTTFQYGGSAGKRHRLREAMLWVDPPEYYSGEWCAHEGRCHCFEHLNKPCIWGPPEYDSGEWGDRLHQEGFCALSSWIAWFPLSSSSSDTLIPCRGPLPQRGPAVPRNPGRLPGPQPGAQFITARICVLRGSLTRDGVLVHGLPLALHCQRRETRHPLPGSALNARGPCLHVPMASS